MTLPQPPDGASSLKEGAFDVAVPKSLPPRGRWMRAKRADGGSLFSRRPNNKEMILCLYLIRTS